jgi:hypothetical protein
VAIDTSIYSNLLRPPKSVAEYDAEAVQGQQNRLALLLNQNKAEDYQRERAGENKLAELLARGGSSDQIGADLARSGYAKQALAYTKQQQDIAKSKADAAHVNAQTGKLTSETGKIDYEQREAKRQKAITDIAGFTSGDQALASLDLHEKAGNIAPEHAALIRQTMPQNPADFPKWQIGMLQRIMSANDIVTANETARHHGAAEKTAAGQLAVSQGQLGVAQGNLKVAQTRETREASAPRGQVVQTDSGPVLVDPRTGSARPVTGVDGKPVTSAKAPTEFQGKSAAFGARAEQADKILGGLDGKYSPAAINSKGAVENTWLVGGALGAATNKFALNEADQQAEQAQRDFINAVLRQESGAAIGAGEFDNAKKQYFPQPGDKPGQLAQKAANRKLAVEGLKRNAGHAAFSAPAAASDHPPEIESLLKKYGQ